MTQTQHTQGPWRVSGFIKFTDPLCGENNYPIIHNDKIDIGYMCIGNDDMKANAALIAAAPDLLEALRKIDAHGYVTGDDFDMVRAAIAKATGGNIA